LEGREHFGGEVVWLTGEKDGSRGMRLSKWISLIHREAGVSLEAGYPVLKRATACSLVVADRCALLKLGVVDTFVLVEIQGKLCAFCEIWPELMQA
jgi:hypothetical protein